MGVKRDFRGRRWVNITLRSLHLTGVVQVGVAIFSNGTLSVAGMALMLSTGLGLYGLELWHHFEFWRELAGVFSPVKLILLLVMLLVPDYSAPLFWVLLLASSVVSHAPWEFRHKRIIG